MMKRGLLVAWFWFFGISVFAQEDPVLMRVNGKDILRSEFEYSYRHRTGNADAKLSPKEYAELFAQSKLKVEAAKVAGLDYYVPKTTGSVAKSVAQILFDG